MRKNHCQAERNFPKQCCHPIWRPVIYPKKQDCNRWQPLGLIGKHCCTLHPTANCWAATWSSTFPQIYQWHNLDSYIKIVKWKHRTSTTSAFSNSALELTFRQACTADQKGEVEFLDVNHCITTDDDFGFVTKDFVKPTAEGRQLINRKSHHPQSTFKSILFGEAIRLRHLNQRKQDYLSSLNRLKEKAIHSRFPLDMTNDMIAMVSNWEERLWAPKGEKKDDPQVWDTSFMHLITLTKRETITNYKHLALSKTREHVKGMSGPCGYCALYGNHGKHNKSLATSQHLKKSWEMIVNPNVDGHTETLN